MQTWTVLCWKQRIEAWILLHAVDNIKGTAKLVSLTTFVCIIYSNLMTGIIKMNEKILKSINLKKVYKITLVFFFQYFSYVQTRRSFLDGYAAMSVMPTRQLSGKSRHDTLWTMSIWYDNCIWRVRFKTRLSVYVQFCCIINEWVNNIDVYQSIKWNIRQGKWPTVIRSLFIVWGRHHEMH